jgi:hypothetical protein
MRRATPLCARVTRANWKAGTADPTMNMWKPAFPSSRFLSVADLFRHERCAGLGTGKWGTASTLRIPPNLITQIAAT